MHRKYKLIAFITLTLPVSACVMIERYRYVDLSGDNVQIKITRNIEHENHVGSRGPIPMKYIVKEKEFTVSFERFSESVSGGLEISAISTSGEVLNIKRTEPSINVSSYGVCRTYNTPTPQKIYFYDGCPSSLSRQYYIAFNVILTGGEVVPFKTNYNLKSSGAWWALDGP